MAPSKWDDEDAASDTGSGPAVPPVIRRKFDDEEEDSDDVADDWAEDSEVERRKEAKAKREAEAAVKAAAKAAANKRPPKAERIAANQAQRASLAGEESSEEEETETQKRQRNIQSEIASDLEHSEDLLGGAGDRPAPVPSAAVALDATAPHDTVNLATLPLLNPTTRSQFEQLRNVLGPLITIHANKAHYCLFLQEFCKQLAADLPSDQIKKVASMLTTLSNERLTAEKAADKSGKKSKAQKTKNSLVAARPTAKADVESYDNDDFGDDDFM